MKLPVEYSKLDFRKGEVAMVRRQYVKEQDGLCYYCGSLLGLPPPELIINKKINWELFPENFLDNPIHLQHNHDTDMTEGAVHAYCNAVLWEYEGR